MGLVEYISTYIAENPNPDQNRYTGNDYIRSTDIDDIIAGSPNILKIRAEKLTFVSPYNQTELYRCTILKSYKGNIEMESFATVFMANVIEEGKEYIVMLDEAGMMSSKNSVYDADDAAVLSKLENLE